MKRKFPALLLRNERHQLTRGDILAAAHMAVSVNIARHLVNVPGGALQPKTYSDLAKALFTDSDTVTVEVWEGDKLVQERMNLLLAVGQAASQAPRLVHLRYRPKMGNGKKPIALVGKGITFDSGGLDLIHLIKLPLPTGLGPIVPK